MNSTVKLTFAFPILTTLIFSGCATNSPTDAERDAEAARNAVLIRSKKEKAEPDSWIFSPGSDGNWSPRSFAAEGKRPQKACGIKLPATWYPKHHAFPIKSFESVAIGK